MLAAILGAALTGLEDEMEPQPAVTGNAYAMDLPQIPASWEAAIDAFEHSDVLYRFLRKSRSATRADQTARAALPGRSSPRKSGWSLP